LVTAAGPTAAAAQDSLIFELSPASRLDVLTGRAGLLGSMGHEHLVRARGFNGRIVYVPRDLGRSSVTITVPTDSLEILTDAGADDRAKMRRAMRERTLQVTRFPEISFVSNAVEQVEEGKLRLRGRLTMTGMTRPVTVDVTLRLSTDTLRATGGFSVKQTDFGITPYSTALGSVKVADVVRFDFEVVATRSGQ
jgi:polyisoprenoid-binding protein YceI